MQFFSVSKLNSITVLCAMFHQPVKLITLLFGLMRLCHILGQKVEEAVVPIELLTEESCAKKRSGCCSAHFFGDSPALFKCLAIHSANLPDKDDKDMSKLLKFFSCLVECIYKKSRFIGKGNKLNMKMVKLEAEHLYVGRPKEKAYYIKSYESCEIQVQDDYKLLITSPGTRLLMKKACRPYFMLLYQCIIDYHHKNECPYFRWTTTGISNPSDPCHKARARCYAIDGLKVPVGIHL